MNKFFSRKIHFIYIFIETFVQLCYIVFLQITMLHGLQIVVG